MSGRSSVVESLLPKQVVVGSNPIARSNTFNNLLISPFFPSCSIPVPVTVGCEFFPSCLNSNSGPVCERVVVQSDLAETAQRFD